MPSLLLVGLGQAATKRYIAEALLGGGYELVLLSTSVPEWIAPRARAAQSADLTASDAIERAVALGRTYAVDGVLTADETCVELVASTASRLGLPALSERAAALCRDKYAMRRQFRLAGVPSARCELVRSIDEALGAAAAVGYPVVLKPRNLGGSIGVVRADDEDEVRTYFDAAATATMSRVKALPGLLVEEYVEGDEVSVESVVADGVTTVCGITEKQLGYAPFFEEVGHLARPVRADDRLDRQLTETVRKVHEALGVVVGVTHCEMRLAADGPRVIEIGARLAGDRIPEITKLASGVDLILAAAAVATGRQPELRPTASRVAGIRMVYPPRSGLVTRLEADGAAAGLSGMGWYASVGERVLLPPEGFLSRLGYLVAVGDSREDVTRRLDTAASALDVEIVPERRE